MSNDKDENMRESGNDDETVAKLMNLAGPRAAIPTDLEQRVHENVRTAWRRSSNKKRSLHWAIPAAMAATVLLVIAINFRAPEVTLQPLGQIAYVAGGDSAADSDYVVGGSVYAGDFVQTSADQGLSISLAGDISLRIAADSSVRFDTADEFTLIRGQMYADSGERIYRDRQITINTTVGSATDIGTQFSVAYNDRNMSVAVREGRVDVSSDRPSVTALAGDKLTLQPGNEVVTDQITPYDSHWDWAASLAPGFDIADRSLLDFLKWASRETGKSLVFSSDDVRMSAMRTQLFGSVENFTPTEAIESVLSTTQFKYRVDEKSITITK
jgi:ferric-dicitrate binding protein FerR (iron transport regulator)